MKNHPIDEARSSDNPELNAVAGPEAGTVVDPDVVGTDCTSAGDGDVVMALFAYIILVDPGLTDLGHSHFVAVS